MKSQQGCEYDLIVVGGGPAGSTVATLVAMQGHRVLLLEKQTYPIYKIGESLLPATVHGICSILGVKDELEKAKFVTKYGGTFKWGKSEQPWTFRFSASPKMAGPTASAYQVERMKFDSILLSNAREKNVDVRENHSVSDLIMDHDRVAGVNYIDNRGEAQTARAPYVADASGHRSTLWRNAGERIYSNFFQNVAIFGYYEGGRRLPPPNEGNIFSVAFQFGWFWYIPLSDTLTSVGAVISKEYAHKVTENREAILEELVQHCPEVQKMLAPARRIVTGPYGQVRIRSDYSYCNTRFWKGGLVLLGDAACFVDPVFSSGVHLATYSALQAARSINSRLRDLFTDEICFNEFDSRYRREYLLFYDFLTAFYDLHQEPEEYFWNARKIVGSGASANEAFVELVAGVAGWEEKLYESAEKGGRRHQCVGAELFDPVLNGLGEGTREGDRRTQFFGQLLREVTQVQSQALLGDRRVPDQPLFVRGLAPSRDGLHWAERTNGRGPTSRSDASVG